MNSITILIVLLCCAISQSARGRDPDWFQKRMAQLDQALLIQDTNQKIAALGEFLRIGELGMDDEQQQIFDKTQKNLLSIPGHAKYYGKDIRRMVEVEFATRQHPSDRRGDFETLEQLPSPESVRVLGELLFDERNPFKSDRPDDSPWSSNAISSASTLGSIGLKNRPVGTANGVAREDLHYWQLWYERVRAGNQTFSFKGDDKVYSLRGPVVKETRAKRIPGVRKHAADETLHKNREPAADWRPILYAGFGLLIVAFAIWHVRKKYRKSS